MTGCIRMLPISTKRVTEAWRSLRSLSRASITPNNNIYFSSQRRRLHSRPITTFHTPRPTTTTTTTPTQATRKPIPKSKQATRTMSTDNTYLSFLEKANADPSTTQSGEKIETTTTTDNPPLQTKTVDDEAVAQTGIPAPLKDVEDVFYVSETDEPFEPVVLGWKGGGNGDGDGGWPDAAQFSTLTTSPPTTTLSDNNAISILSPTSFDPRNQYARVFSAVRRAVSASRGGSGDDDVEIRVYRVEVSRTGVEYWVLGVDGVHGRVLGVRGRGVET